MVIYFNVKEAREHLMGNGFVYTLRPRMRNEGRETAVNGSYYRHESIFKVVIAFEKEISVPADLLKYVKDSGFKTVNDWLWKAKGSKYLYRVTVVDE